MYMYMQLYIHNMYNYISIYIYMYVSIYIYVHAYIYKDALSPGLCVPLALLRRPFFEGQPVQAQLEVDGPWQMGSVVDRTGGSM